MAPRNSSLSEPWWRRQPSSVVTMAVVLAVIALVTVAMAYKVADVLPEVPKDQLGEDRWAEPLGIELKGEFQIGHIPDCAEGPISRIVLWNADSEPYWEVSGEAKPFKAFVVGGPPEGFKVITPYREPPPGEVLRLIAFRTVGGAVGIRYQADALRTDRVVSGTPLSSFTVDGFQDALVCSGSAGSDPLTPEELSGTTDKTGTVDSAPEATDATGTTAPG